MSSLPKTISSWSPILCKDEAQPGLFAEFVIVRDVRQPKEMAANCPQLTKPPQHSPRSLECLVHKCIKDQRQLLDELSLPDAFPAGFENFQFFKPPYFANFQLNSALNSSCPQYSPKSIDTF